MFLVVYIDQITTFSLALVTHFETRRIASDTRLDELKHVAISWRTGAKRRCTYFNRQLPRRADSLPNGDLRATFQRDLLFSTTRGIYRSRGLIGGKALTSRDNFVCRCELRLKNLNCEYGIWENRIRSVRSDPKQIETVSAFRNEQRHLTPYSDYIRNVEITNSKVILL